jgi:hypothetical protein
MRLAGFCPELMECTRLQEKEESDFDPIQSTVCGEKGLKRCTTILPDRLRRKLSDPA